MTTTTTMNSKNSILRSLHYSRRQIIVSASASATTTNPRMMMTTTATLPRKISLPSRTTTTTTTTNERTLSSRSYSSASSSLLSLWNNNHNSSSSIKSLKSNTYDTLLHSPNITATNYDCNDRRSIVTITQTKVSDDDISSLSSSLSSSNEGTVSKVSTNGAGVSSAVSASLDTDINYAFNPDTTLIVTGSCLNRVETLLKQRDDGGDDDDDDGSSNHYFLRVFVDAGGCSGFQYQFELDNELDEDNDDNDDDDDDDDAGEDVIIVSTKTMKSNNNNDDDSDTDDDEVLIPRVVIDKTSLGFLEGSTIDYVVEMIKSSFVVTDNPLSESACGCGSSFAVKNFEKFGAKD